MTYSEFVSWIAFLKMEDKRFQKWEWYAAQIAMVIARVHGNKKKLSDFTLGSNVPKRVKPRRLIDIIRSAFGGEVKEE
jgi:hypothetical protein